jgi:hypothetical protein
MLEAMFPSPPICMLLHGPGVMFPPTDPLLFTALLEFEDFGLLGRRSLLWRRPALRLPITRGRGIVGFRVRCCHGLLFWE